MKMATHNVGNANGTGRGNAPSLPMMVVRIVTLRNIATMCSRVSIHSTVSSTLEVTLCSSEHRYNLGIVLCTRSRCNENSASVAMVSPSDIRSSHRVLLDQCMRSDL